MSTLYFYLGTVLIIIAVTTLLTLSENKKRKKEIKNLWESHSKWLEYNESFINFDNYYRNLTAGAKVDKTAEVDDITWRDLDMDRLLEEINYAFTTIGEERLYVALRNVAECDDIKENLVQKFEEDITWREKITLILSKLSKQPNSNTSKYFFNRNYSKSEKYRPQYLLLSFLSLIGIFLISINFLLGIFTIIGSLLINMIISYKHKSRHEDEYSNLFYGLNIINVASQLNNYLKKETEDQIEIKGKVKNLQLVSALLINENTDQNNLFLQMLTGIKNAFVLDYHVYHYIIKVLNNNKDTYEKCWQFVAGIDLNYSVAMWRKTLPYYSIPSRKNKGNLKTTSVYHPLISEPVSNSIDLSHNILLTGSNASGKSTFMKSLALNVILSNGISTSTSKHFEYVPGKVFSSMDISDSISEGDSYFISEVKSLKRIIDTLEVSDHNIYCFIDEIFKGTNTKERLAAAEVLLRFLNADDRVSMIAATHDIELTESLINDMIMYHFSEVLEDEDIFFDYKIKKGPAQTSNAIELLRLFNFPKEIYDESKEKLNKPVNSNIG
ncbi:MutS-related protein [Salinicoccus roseus]|uniref:MutS-related protein n=1 Tax=Salinicoccus roseus TaxID=45670 RepID=UPI000FC00673|nr:hypothetical protein [Salinicoccus roseus]RPE52905.1 MutS-like protein [Salinicoccus roseus]GGA72443.1 DNA mismatch repair protein MutS [Salinicoccus roseus]